MGGWGEDRLESWGVGGEGCRVGFGCVGGAEGEEGEEEEGEGAGGGWRGGGGGEGEEDEELEWCEDEEMGLK